MGEIPNNTEVRVEVEIWDADWVNDDLMAHTQVFLKPPFTTRAKEQGKGWYAEVELEAWAERKEK